MTTPLKPREEQQFEQLFQRSHLRAYRLAYRLTGNAADAEDLTQDAYVRAWHCFDRYDANCSFESWLFRILTNRAIDMQRRKKRVRLLSLDTPIQGDEAGRLCSQEFAAPDSDPLQILIERTLDDRLQKALAALSKDFRTALLLRDVEQHSYQEVADTMRCALGTVRSRIHRARQIIKRRLEKRSH